MLKDCTFSLHPKISARSSDETMQSGSRVAGGRLSRILLDKRRSAHEEAQGEI